ncbi:argonaute 2 [Penaeus vannamei]|uniref:Argonaute 2 n=1 Tax=Penaeus vannamei TaxID=6689 RepID=A0A3R7QJ95_PENVA|nr:argonaute 2 [Penaeus vannamei]
MPWISEVLPENPKPPTRSKDKQTVAGTLGRVIKLKANYYPITVKSWDKHLFHYDVVIEEPNRGEMDIPKKKKLMIFDGLKMRYPQFFKEYNLAYDGMKSAVGLGKIPELSDGRAHQVHISGDSGKKSRYILKLRIVNTHSLKDLEVALKKCSRAECVELPSTIFQMLGIMFQRPSTHFSCVGQNSFFPLDGELGPSHDIGGGKEIKPGFFGSIRPSGWKHCPLLLNLDELTLQAATAELHRNSRVVIDSPTAVAAFNRRRPSAATGGSRQINPTIIKLHYRFAPFPPPLRESPTGGGGREPWNFGATCS